MFVEKRKYDCTGRFVNQRCVTCHVICIALLRLVMHRSVVAQGRTAALQRKLKDLAKLVFVNAPHAITATPSGPTEAGNAAPAHPAAIRRAWLVAKQQMDGQDIDAGDEQWRRQTEGWPASEAALLDVLQHEGPFDGVLGFSQGAAVAAALCAQQQQQQQQQQQLLAPAKAATSLRFAILCSGYPSAAPEHKAMHAEIGPLQLPTLHMFGSHAAQNQATAGHNDSCSHPLQQPVRTCDQQVSTVASRQLLDLCEQRLCHVVEHSNGHMIPVDKRCIQRLRTFLLHVAGTGTACV